MFCILRLDHITHEQDGRLRKGTSSSKKLSWASTPRLEVSVHRWNEWNRANHRHTLMSLRLRLLLLREQFGRHLATGEQSVNPQHSLTIID